MAHHRLDACRQGTCDIFIEPGALDVVGERMVNLCPEAGLAVIVTDQLVRGLYACQLRAGIQNLGYRCCILDVPSGERSKSLATAASLWNQLTSLRFQRRDVLIALGGGVITDLTGFVAATYMRGVPYINVPTSLVAQLDAAIGGKVAVDHEHAKNLIGSFYHPRVVCIDPNALPTLPIKEIQQGLAEAIKVAIIASPPLFEFIERNSQTLLEGDCDALTDVVNMAINAKINLVSDDLYENQLDRGLNFGHAIGHALESVLAYRGITHGDAVAVGMSSATRLAYMRGICDAQTSERILTLLKHVGLPVSVPGLASHQLCEALAVIRAIRGGTARIVVPARIGHYAIVNDLPDAELAHCLQGG